ncbi:hypothetical protein FQ192_25730 [Pseudomonas sp. ANT_J12]|nr:hypothetical protein FQ192_25730 [Pseudomonas sp. ANT_J12]
MLAKNDDAVYLIHRVVCFASKLGSYTARLSALLNPFVTRRILILSQNKNKEPSCSISARSPKPMPCAGLPI